ncbi:MAG: TIGR00730 family Rossman fold protein [Caulobacterales bacterium]|nr:TIGR00730 family Rossman fold protein [Caulobacterales bacterium]
MTYFRSVKVRSVALFCGSSPGHDPRHRALAAEFGEACAEAAVRLVFGGGRVGLMGAAASAALEAGGSVFGVLPERLTSQEIIFDEADVAIVADMAERKQRMCDESDAFVALPGGVGTLDEIVEMMTWARLGLHDKPIILLDDDDYWDPFFDLIDHQIGAGFATREAREGLSRARTARSALWMLGARVREEA